VPKVLIGLCETGQAFTYRHMEEPRVGEELAALWSMKRFPLRVEDGQSVIERR